MDVASNLYFAYEGLCLFFTTPLALFATPLPTRLLRHTCRIPKLQFVGLFLALWWAYQYVIQLLNSTQLELYLHNITTDVRVGGWVSGVAAVAGGRCN